MNRGSRLQCPTKVDGWNSHDLQGDICDICDKVDGWKGCSFSLCKDTFQVLSFGCLLQIQHNLLSQPALQKKSALPPPPRRSSAIQIAERVASGSNWATSIHVTFYLASKKDAYTQSGGVQYRRPFPLLAAEVVGGGSF